MNSRSRALNSANERTDIMRFLHFASANAAAGFPPQPRANVRSATRGVERKVLHRRFHRAMDKAIGLERASIPLYAQARYWHNSRTTPKMKRTSTRAHLTFWAPGHCRFCLAERGRDGKPWALYVFSVAQIFNLPDRRFVIGRAPIVPKTADFANDPQVANLRYSAARPSRNQTLPLLHRMEERAGERRFFPLVKLGCPSPQSSPHSCVVGRGEGKRTGRNRRGSRRFRQILTDSKSALRTGARRVLGALLRCVPPQRAFTAGAAGRTVPGR